MQEKRAGFTLVELAIVLVIIGIILGAVLKSQEIIKNAKIKRLKSDYLGYLAAIYTYQDRYGSLPGDDRYAPEHLAGLGICTSGIHRGNGNGRMDDEDTGTYGYYWQHLRCAGIIPGSGSAHPTHVFGGKVYIDYIAGHTLCFTNIPGDVADAIDRSDDDGVPNSGSIQDLDGATSYDPAKAYTLCFRI